MVSFFLVALSLKDILRVMKKLRGVCKVRFLQINQYTHACILTDTDDILLLATFGVNEFFNHSSGDDCFLLFLREETMTHYITPPIARALQQRLMLRGAKNKNLLAPLKITLPCCMLFHSPTRPCRVSEINLRPKRGSKDQKNKKQSSPVCVIDSTNISSINRVRP